MLVSSWEFFVFKAEGAVVAVSGAAAAMAPALASESELKKMGGLSILEPEAVVGADAEDEEDDAAPEVAYT